jgi:hypothetical protein
MNDSGYEIMPDEFLPSYELRLRLINGEIQNISSLAPFSSLDCRFWYAVPLIIKKESFFKNIADSTLRKLILKHTYSQEFAAYNDVYFLPRIISLLKGKNAPKLHQRSNMHAKRFSIKFCKLCFIAQIREFGFAWFRLPWLNKKEICDVHLIPLELISCTKCMRSITGLNALISALRGTCLQCSHPLYTDSFDSTEYKMCTPDRYYSPPIALCFELELKKLFRQLQKRGDKKLKKSKTINGLSSLERKALLFNFFPYKTRSYSDSFSYMEILHLMFSGEQEKLLGSFNNLWTKRNVTFNSVNIVQETIVGVNSNCDTCKFQRGCIY